jgi:hypothetical protein
VAGAGLSGGGLGHRLLGQACWASGQKREDVGVDCELGKKWEGNMLTRDLPKMSLVF